MRKIEIEMSKSELESLIFPIIIETSGIVVWENKSNNQNVESKKLIENYIWEQVVEHLPSELEYLESFINKEALYKDRSNYLKVYKNIQDLLKDYDYER